MRPPQVFNIPFGTSFVDALARGLLAETGGDPLALGTMTVLLPTRRAAQSLAAAFLRENGGRPLLLPIMRPLGDLDEEELVLRAEDEAPGAAALDLPPAVSPLRRQLLLTRLIMRADRAITADQGSRLAAELGRLLDQIQIERLSFDRLEDLAPEQFAAHWQQTLRFLEILTHHWPAILAEEGRIDQAERRNRIIEAQAEQWRRHPPDAPVIAAGSTGSMPATAELLSVVAHLPRGSVVLPGLDTLLDDESWKLLEPTHPQYGLARLLETLGIDRGSVRPWHGTGFEPSARMHLVSETMRPAAATDAWRHLDLDFAEALRDVTRIDCAGPEEEARTVALMLREAIENGETASLVTPDRALAQRVAAEMHRWHVQIDDSGGDPLAETPPLTFLRLIAACAAEDAAPVPLLAMLKHPLASGGMAPERFRRRVRRLELTILRGPRPRSGFDGLKSALVALAGEHEAELPKRAEEARGLAHWIDGLAARARPFFELSRSGRARPDELLAAHIAFAEALAATDEAPGAQRLWRGDAGDAAAGFVSELSEASAGFGAISGRDWAGFFDTLLEGRVVRTRYGTHPAVAIWGALEARLQHADHLILGGLNEGTWPPEPRVDPWMSRPMRAAFGLPSPERRIGLSAHDFTQAFGARRVTLTRATRSEGAPTVPARWLLRLDSVLQAAGHRPGDAEAKRWTHWQESLDTPERFRPIDPPWPRPALVARPRQLSVTQIETWLRDPYALYANRILRLSPLDPLDADPGALERGSFLHAALEAFLKDFPDALPEDAVERLLEHGRSVFGETLERPGVWAFWWPRFENVARWFVENERAYRHRVASTATETKGKICFETPGGGFKLVAKADRIDRLREGGAAIVDYKTGSRPSPSEVHSGASPQMPLEAAILEGGGFSEVGAQTAVSLEYWRLTGGDPAGEIHGAGGRDGIEGLAEMARLGLERYVAKFDDPATPYLAQPRPELAPRFSDYGHLARIQEWARTGDER